MSNSIVIPQYHRLLLYFFVGMYSMGLCPQREARGSDVSLLS